MPRTLTTELGLRRVLVDIIQWYVAVVTLLGVAHHQRPLTLPNQVSCHASQQQEGQGDSYYYPCPAEEVRTETQYIMNMCLY